MLHTRSPVARCTMLPPRILGPKYWAFAQESDFVLLMNRWIQKESNMTERLALTFKGAAIWSIQCKLLHNILGHVFKNSVLFLHGMTEIKTKQYRTFWSRFSWTIGINLLSVLFSFVSVTICASISVMVYSKICQIRNRFLNISQLSFFAIDSFVLTTYHQTCVSGLETAKLK